MSPACSRGLRASPLAPATCACAPGRRIRRCAAPGQKLVRQHKHDIELTAEGQRFLTKSLQISADMLAHPRRPVCKACLDWSERRHHLAGTLGAAMMTRFTELKWAARDAAPGSRVVNFTRNGEKRFAALFGESVS
jgi:hypothetical protein